MDDTSIVHQSHISHNWKWLTGKVSSFYFYGFVVLLFTVHTQCKKASPTQNILPPVTQEGKNTFGCKVNGMTWSPFSTCKIFIGRACKELGFKVYHKDSIRSLPIGFFLEAERTGGEMAYSSFLLYTPATNITQTGNIIDSIAIFYYKDSNQFYHFPHIYTSGSVYLTKLDTVNRIVSGTFSFTLNNTRGDSVVVTDGRFDLTYNACLCH